MGNLSAGVSVQEAQLLGKPVLVTKSGGANSLVTEESAIVVDKGSTEALVKGLKAMAERFGFQKDGTGESVSKDVQTPFDSKKIRAYAVSQFEIDQVSQKYMEIYNSISK